MKFITQQQRLYLIALATVLILLIGQTEAGQGCPFEDGSCQDYCSQQGCNLGYCGHFAWIQCICRKCGDEWNTYDKIRYKPDQKVNQTELDSLNLNSTDPIILTNSTTSNRTQESAQQIIDQSSNNSNGDQSRQNQSQQQQQQQQVNKQQATLTTLLIPDLSEPNEKIDPNEVPDENSEKFLDYLAQNHDRLAQATRAGKDSQGDDENEQGDQQDANGENQQETGTEETVEIQINSGSIGSNNHNNNSQQPIRTTISQQQQNEKSPLETTPNAGLMKLVKLAVAQRSSEEIN